LLFKLLSIHVLGKVGIRGLLTFRNRFGTARVYLNLAVLFQVFGDVEQDESTLLNILWVIDVYLHEEFERVRRLEEIECTSLAEL